MENPLGYSLRSLLLKREEPCPLILANVFLNHPESFIKDEIQVWLLLVQIFHAIPRALFSAFAYLLPSVGQTYSKPGCAGFPLKELSEG